jgi:hypothetical protein
MLHKNDKICCELKFCKYKDHNIAYIKIYFSDILEILKYRFRISKKQAMCTSSYKIPQLVKPWKYALFIYMFPVSYQ